MVGKICNIVLIR
uniref:Uncharacterized protein n=1 Tax=Rhizophora mucronata TaxID=61149 RepID=A0A2P2R4A8_RHIMU